MMMMTIWWSKATRLLEFSRSLRDQLGSTFQPEKRDTFCVTGRQTDGGIGYSSSWMYESGRVGQFEAGFKFEASHVAEDCSAQIQQFILINLNLLQLHAFAKCFWRYVDEE